MQGKQFTAKFWNTTFLKALEESMGNVSSACRKLNMAPQTFYLYIHNNQKYREKVTKLQDGIIVPFLVEMVKARAFEGDNKLLLFLLRNLGGERWNRDITNVHLARIEAEIRKAERINEENFRARNEIDNEQRVPTEEEVYVATACRKALMKYRAEHPEEGKK